MWFLAMIAYFWPGPGSSDVILQMAACAWLRSGLRRVVRDASWDIIRSWE